MKSLKQFIFESSSRWVGSIWTSSSAIPLDGNRYSIFDIENVKNYINELSTNYKWNTDSWQFVSVQNNLKSEDDIENYIDSYIKERAKKYTDEKRFTYKDFTELVKEIYDQLVYGYDYMHKDGKKNHPWVEKNGEILKLDDWLKTICGYDCDVYDNHPYEGARTWEEYIKDEWQKVQKDKQDTINQLTLFAKDYIQNTINKSENDIRNIKLDKKIEFGSITSRADRQSTREYGYVKIGEGSKEGKTLILDYTKNKTEALELNTLGDLLDLLYKYKKCKLITPAGVSNTKYANSIMLYPKNKYLTNAYLGIIKFRI